jgi:hypothetical protein
MKNEVRHAAVRYKVQVNEYSTTETIGISSRARFSRSRIKELLGENLRSTFNTEDSRDIST